MNILILGANGQVGWELQRSLSPVGPFTALGRHAANLEDLDNLRAVVREHQPDVIVNAAAYTAVDKAEEEPDKAKLINTDAVALLAEEAAISGSWLFHYSTDYVFNGQKKLPYTESDSSAPINVYGQTKWQGEEAIRQIGCKHVIFRTSWVYAARGSNFVKTMLRLAKDLDELSVVADQFGVPTQAELIADITAHVIPYCMSEPNSKRLELAGTYHLTAAGETSWFEYARYILETAEKYGATLKVKSSDIKPISTEEYQVSASRPQNSILSCEKLQQAFNMYFPDWHAQVRRTVKELVEQR